MGVILPFGWTSGLQEIKNVTTNRQYAFLGKQYLAKETIFAQYVKRLCHHLTFVSLWACSRDYLTFLSSCYSWHQTLALSSSASSQPSCH